MKVHPLDLRPTQMALGMREVRHRIEKMAGMSAHERRAYLRGHKIPVVLGPRGRVFLVDHHHLVRACWELGIKDVPVTPVGRLSGLSFRRLWRVLAESHWLHTYDQLGHGPHDPIHLPETVSGMADDPYRSLAWLVRERGGYRKTNAPFSEFRWADFFRRKLRTHPVFHGMEAAVKEALALCRTRAARRLPGHLSRRQSPRRNAADLLG